MLSMKQTIGELVLQQKKLPKINSQSDENQQYIQKVIASKSGFPEDSEREQKKQDLENKELREQIRQLQENQAQMRLEKDQIFQQLQYLNKENSQKTHYQQQEAAKHQQHGKELELRETRIKDLTEQVQGLREALNNQKAKKESSPQKTGLVNRQQTGFTTLKKDQVRFKVQTDQVAEANSYEEDFDEGADKAEKVD